MKVLSYRLLSFKAFCSLLIAIIQITKAFVGIMLTKAFLVFVAVFLDKRKKSQLLASGFMNMDVACYKALNLNALPGCVRCKSLFRAIYASYQIYLCLLSNVFLLTIKCKYDCCQICFCG